MVSSNRLSPKTWGLGKRTSKRATQAAHYPVPALGALGVSVVAVDQTHPFQLVETLEPFHETRWALINAGASTQASCFLFLTGSLRGIWDLPNESIPGNQCFCELAARNEQREHLKDFENRSENNKLNALPRQALCNETFFFLQKEEKRYSQIAAFQTCWTCLQFLPFASASHISQTSGKAGPCSTSGSAWSDTHRKSLGISPMATGIGVRFEASQTFPFFFSHLVYPVQSLKWKLLFRFYKDTFWAFPKPPCSSF